MALYRWAFTGRTLLRSTPYLVAGSDLAWSVAQNPLEYYESLYYSTVATLSRLTIWKEMMSTTYLQLNKPPWRYLASAAVLFALVVVFFVAHGRTYVEHKEVFSGVTRSADDFLDDIHNHTLGVGLQQKCYLKRVPANFY